MLYDLLELFVDAMNDAARLPQLLLWLLIGSPVVAIVHEAGHALAAVLRRQRDIAVHIGSYGTQLSARIGDLRLTVGGERRALGVSDYVTFDAARATATDVLVIALAGPLASLLAVVPFALLAGATDGALHDYLAYLWIGTLVAAVVNVIPMRIQEGTRKQPGPSFETDGRQALDALRLRRDLRRGTVVASPRAYEAEAPERVAGSFPPPSR